MAIVPRPLVSGAEYEPLSDKSLVTTGVLKEMSCKSCTFTGAVEELIGMDPFKASNVPATTSGLKFESMPERPKEKFPLSKVVNEVVFCASKVPLPVAKVSNSMSSACWLDASVTCSVNDGTAVEFVRIVSVVRPSFAPTVNEPPVTADAMDNPAVPLLMSISPPVMLPDAEVGEPLVVMLPATSSGKLCTKSTPVKATAYCPVVPVVVSEADEKTIVTVDVPELLPAVAVIVTV